MLAAFTIGLFFSTMMGPFAQAQSARVAAPQPAVRVVFFTADWCPNCRVLAPRLEAAMRGAALAEQVDIDITDSARWDASLERALDKRLVRLYNAYVGTTGFAVIAAADTGETIACVTRVHEASVIAALTARAIARTRERAPGARADGRDPACPAERAPPPPP
jgi:thiol-disulfide isomerase/thioredoxin